MYFDLVPPSKPLSKEPSSNKLDLCSTHKQQWLLLALQAPAKLPQREAIWDKLALPERTEI